MAVHSLFLVVIRPCSIQLLDVNNAVEVMISSVISIYSARNMSSSQGNSVG